MIDIYPIVCENRDMLYGVSRACQLGYHVIPYPGSTTGFEKKYGTQIADGLRRSAVAMIEGTPLKHGGTNCIFAEADFYPFVSCEDLETLVKTAPDDWDVLQLWSDGYANSQTPEARDLTAASIDLNDTGWWTPTPNRHFCTHAMMFRNADVVKAILNTWTTVAQPIDESLIRMPLKIYRPNAGNLFGQYNPEDQYATPPRDRRFLVGMGSYRRIRDCCRQIYTFMDQTYKNFIMHVSLRGISEYDWKRRLAPNFKHFIDEGRLVVDITPNSTQLINVAAITDNIPDESYDLITKVDDDDWYDREYLERLNRVHRHIPVNCGSSDTCTYGYFRLQHGIPQFVGGQYPSFTGGVMVHSKDSFKAYKEYALTGNKDILRKWFTLKGDRGLANEGWTWREDALLDRMEQAHGRINRHYLTEPYSSPGQCVTAVGAGVTRHMYSWRTSSYDFILTINPGVQLMRISGNTIYNLYHLKTRKGVVLSRDENTIVVLWDGDAAMQVLKRTKDGSWSIGEYKPDE